METKPDVFTLFERVEADLRNEGRIGTANCYRDAARSFKAFVDGTMKQHKESRKHGKAKTSGKKKTLKFEDVTAHFLKRYAKAVELAGNSSTTAAMHFRSLRRIYNSAISLGITGQNCTLSADLAASVGERFSIPQTSGNKRALSIAQIEAILQCKNLTEAERQARDFWLLSMYCNGMNFGDMFRLRRSDISLAGGFYVLSFYRQKTIRRIRRKQIAVVLPLEIWQHVEAIIVRHGNPDTRPDLSNIFVLTDAKNPDEEKRLVQYAIRFANRHLKAVAQKSGLDIPISTYHARHSFASLLKRSGAPVAMISDALGHSSNRNDRKLSQRLCTRRNSRGCR